MKASRYVPEIDGLRTIAVMVVLFYHVGFTAFSGGFVGVDVFFVISGFLITRLIRDEVEATGRFDFLRFYVRRVRRLFPAVAATIAGSAVLAFLLFSPQQLSAFAVSAVAAVFSVSNILFWLEADYFDALATTKPLLHTWSLGVEEQFYLVWPALLFLLLVKLPRRAPVVVLALLSVVSLALAEYWLPGKQAAAFYLLPTRIAELGLGGLLVWAVRFRPAPGSPLLEPLLLLGLALIVWPTFAYSETTPFPGLAAMAPCLGAALVLFAGAARVSGSFLRSAPFVWTGRISYSLYLVHWPLIVFWRAFRFDAPGPLAASGLVALSFVLAALQYHLVEERFRHQREGSLPGTRFLARAGLVALAMTAVAGAVVLSNGVPQRIPADRYLLTDRDQRREIERLYCERPDPALPAALFTCQNDRGAGRSIILWGDSHAMHLVPGFNAAYPDANIYAIFLPGCVPERGFGEEAALSGREACVNHNRAALDWLVKQPPADIVLSGAKRGTPEGMSAASAAIISPLEAAGHRVVLLGDAIRPGRHLGDCTNVPGWLVSDDRVAERCQGDPKVAAEELAYNDRVAELVPEFVSPNEVQCPGGACRYFEGRHVLYRDDHHLDIRGSEDFVAGLRDLLPF
jgi:peptidoglycan/LPS O-acetylase OafA/YrhL